MVQWERENGFDHLRKGFEDYDNQKGGDVYDDAATSSETIRTAKPRT